jgi:DNA-binding GntR family transcriptional regulator
MQNNEPRPKSIGAAVADLLRDAILTREFVDGERLPELPLCEKYGVSRIPLREAFQILASEGLIVSTANRGARVRILVPREVDQIFHLRLVLESDLADNSIAGLTEQHVGEAIVAAELFGSSRTIARDNELGRRFLQIIYEAGDRPIQSSIALSLRDQVARLEVPALRKALKQYHALTGSIIEALEARSNVGLRAGIENYLMISRQMCTSLHGTASPRTAILKTSSFSAT